MSERLVWRSLAVACGLLVVAMLEVTAFGPPAWLNERVAMLNVLLLIPAAGFCGYMGWERNR